MIQWRSLCLSLSILCLTGCGYQLGSGSPIDCYHSVCVPFVSGDREGHLTAELIRELTSCTHLCYREDGGELTLEVDLVEVRSDHIGYRFDRPLDFDEHTDRVIPVEGRLTGVVEFCLKDSCTGEVVVGPARIGSSVDYDHDYYTTQVDITEFSMGQLDDINVAHDIALIPLDRKLAKRIVEYLSSASCLEIAPACPHSPECP